MDIFQAFWCIFCGWMLHNMYMALKTAYLKYRVLKQLRTIHERIGHEIDVMERKHLKVVENENADVL